MLYFAVNIYQKEKPTCVSNMTLAMADRVTLVQPTLTLAPPSAFDITTPDDMVISFTANIKRNENPPVSQT